MINISYNISYNIIFNPGYLIWIINLIISISFYRLFKPEIWFSDNNIDNLKNVNPVINISLFSGLNSPKPD